MSTTTTGKAIRQRLSTLIGGLVEIGQQVGAGGTTTTIIDTGNLKGRALPSSMYDNAVLRVTSGTRAGDTTYVDYLDPSTGTLNLDPALGGALADGDEYEIWMRGVDPDYVDRLRDDCLETLVSVWRPVPVTVIPDGDLETAGVTHWSVVSAATRTKALGGFPDVKSRWQLSTVHTTAASDFIDSDTMDCQPGEQFFLEVPVKAYVTATSAASTASVVPVDVTNTADITVGGIRTTHTGRGWGRISILFTIPSGCYQFKIRLKASVNASTAVWGPFACHRYYQTEYTCDDRIRTKRRVGRQFVTTQVVNSTTYVNASRYKIRPWYNVERVQVGTNVVLWFSPALSNSAVYFYERGYFARLETGYVTAAQRSAGDAATTDAPLEYASAAVAEQLAKRMLDKYGADWQDDWVRASTWLNYWDGEFGPEPQEIHENEVPVVIPQVRV